MAYNLPGYVKFIRGTPTAFKNLKEKDPDTLYFISEKGGSVGSLYLGSKSIIATLSGDLDITLDNLKDVIVQNLDVESLLVYNPTTLQWENKSLDSIVDEMKGATADTMGSSGLVPAPGAGEQNYFLRGDGTWASIEGFSHSNIVELEASKEDDIEELINSWFERNNLIPKNSDVAIIKIPLDNGEYSYSSYIYNGDNWIAFTGSYNASNIYFTDDLKTTIDVGYVKVGDDGIETIEAKGKSLKEVFEDIFCKELDPKITYPSLTIKEPIAQKLEVGTYYTPTWKVIFNPGDYEYGPETGIKVSRWLIYDDNISRDDAPEGSFKPIQITTTTNYSFHVKAFYTDGSIPLTNLKNEKESLTIKASTVEKDTPIISGYRNSFYGSFNEKDFKLTSDNIRTLTPSNKALKKGSTFAVPIPIGSQRIVIAYPVSLGEINSICDRNGLGANIKSGFQISQINVEGANGYDAIPYYVYSIDRAEPNKTPNYYDVII